MNYEEKNQIAEMKRINLIKKIAPIENEINDIKTYFIFLRKNDKTNDLLREAIGMRKLTTNNL